MIYTSSIKHPKLFSITKGNTDLDKLYVSINRSIALILLTAKGELFGNPDFGSNIRMYLFNNITDLMINKLKEEIVDSITQWESRITLTTSDINIIADDTKLKINIKYNLVNSEATGSTELLTPLTIPSEV